MFVRMRICASARLHVYEGLFTYICVCMLTAQISCMVGSTGVGKAVSVQRKLRYPIPVGKGIRYEVQGLQCCLCHERGT